MNLLEALKQIAEKTDKGDDKQYYMPRDEQETGFFPMGYFGNKKPSQLLTEMSRQTNEAQQPPQSLLAFLPEAVARFVKEQKPSKNIDDRRGQPKPEDTADRKVYTDLFAPPLEDVDPNDPLAKLLGINSIRPQSMAFDPVPMPRPRPR